MKCSHKLHCLYAPEVSVDPLEPGLLSGEGTAPENGLQVDPSPLDLVELVEELVEVGQPGLPDGGLVGKPLEVRGVLQRLQQALVVSHL